MAISSSLGSPRQIYQRARALALGTATPDILGTMTLLSSRLHCKGVVGDATSVAAAEEGRALAATPLHATLGLRFSDAGRVHLVPAHRGHANFFVECMNERVASRASGGHQKVGRA